MKPGHYFVRTWLEKDVSITSFPDTVTIYDAGNIQGWLIKTSTGKISWIVFQVEFRNKQKDSHMEESGFILHESFAPLHYFSIDTYPMKQESLQPSQILFSLPQTQVLMTVSEALLMPPSQQQLQMPSFLPQPKADVPASHVPRKPNLKRQADGRQLSQNRNKVLPKSKVLSSSNQDRPSQPLLQVPVMQVEHQQLSALVHHNDHESSESHHWTSLAQQSLYSRPPPELEAELSAQVSTSPCLISSE